MTIIRISRFFTSSIKLKLGLGEIYDLHGMVYGLCISLKACGYTFQNYLSQITDLCRYSIGRKKSQAIVQRNVLKVKAPRIKGVTLSAKGCNKRKSYERSSLSD